MLTVFSQVLILILFSGAGFALGKAGLVKNEHTTTLSRLLVYIFLPCNIIKTFWGNFTVAYIKTNYALLLASLGAFGTVAVLSHFGGKLLSKESYEQKVCEYSLAIPNSGYMGYPIADNLLGRVAATSLLTFAIIPNFYIYTLGYWMLTKKSLSFKSLLNPAIISLVIGVLLGITGVPMPQFATDLLETSSACMAPTSMILAGIVVSGFSFKTLLSQKKVYILSAFRLLIIPIAVGLALTPICPNAATKTAVIYFAMPCGLNAVVFPRSIGESCETGAAIAFVSTLASCVTIPIVFALFGIG